MVNEPAAVTSSVKPATCEATASPEVAATSALICASSSAGGPVRSLLQATAPAARNIAAAVSMGFLNFIKTSAPESVFAPQCGCYKHEEARESKRALFSPRDTRRRRKGSKRLAAKPIAPCFGFVGFFAASCSRRRDP